MKLGYLPLIGLFCLATAQADDYFRSTDRAGKIHYGDSPAPNAADVEKVKPKSKPTGNLLPYETKRAVEKFPVTLYSAEGCGDACQQARDLLSNRGVPYTETVLLTATEIADFKKNSGSDVMPTLNIGKLWLQGFLTQQWHQELDKAGYPKSAPYGLRPQNLTTKTLSPK